MQVLFGLVVFVNLLILVSSLDDVFIDAYFWIRVLYRKSTVARRHAPFGLEQLQDREEAHFAIMVPAWKEFDVIASMIENTNANMKYCNYLIFVGTYVNDSETQTEVDRMARRYRNVRRVDVPHPGPTCKADCLNFLIQAVFRHEEQTGRPFSGVVIHDSEDVIHPLELKVFNHFIDRMDLIQLPVLSLEREWYQLVAGTYQDDFAECHSKDMVVRESLTGLVPCAGTGMCYSRRALAALMAETGDSPFNTATLTEDYDFSFRLKKFGLKQSFVKIPFHYTAYEKGWWGERKVERYDLLGVREFFPSTFRTAYRQRTRWILGIALQGWEAMGWKGDLKTKYFMFRDRKGVFTSLVTILAYALLACIGTLTFLGRMGLHVPPLPPGFAQGSWLTRLMQVNAVFMVNRVLQRFIFVNRLYGVTHGLLAIPRVLVSNVINFMAATRAWKQYLRHRITGVALAWDKTAHAYPTGPELRPFRAKLGEILFQWNELEEGHLDAALTEQEITGRQLGSILMERYGVSEANLADAIAFQADLPRSSLNMAVLEQTRNLLPHSLAIHHRWVPLGVGEHEELLLGVSAPPLEAAMAEALVHLQTAPRFFIITESEALCALAYMILGGSSAEMFDQALADRLEHILDLKIEISPVLLGSALADYSYSSHGKLQLFLADRHITNPQPIGLHPSGAHLHLGLQPTPAT
ncbi:bacteriophage N4 adsorption protein B [Geothrix oryzae]|uniref:Bacteriophage N4 adsorption protein B n=1 Tax=Geothrix oryzae TaxID=2927975 RepID=A0ABM8DPA6_9BACT|nr:glycosyl transferase family protein [Geothrix oryzae]BDU68789.1 bacteriophage N4 adsorption protein B [Geothrix oryzae]